MPAGQRVFIVVETGGGWEVLQFVAVFTDPRLAGQALKAWAKEKGLEHFMREEAGDEAAEAEPPIERLAGPRVISPYGDCSIYQVRLNVRRPGPESE